MHLILLQFQTLVGSMEVRSLDKTIQMGAWRAEIVLFTRTVVALDITNEACLNMHAI